MRKSEFYSLTSSSSGLPDFVNWMEKAHTYNDELDKLLEHYNENDLLDELTHNATLILKTQHQMDQFISGVDSRFP